MVASGYQRQGGGWEGRHSRKSGKLLGGEHYLLQMVVPNTYFHLSMACASLRHNGVDLGKMDFLGTVNFVDA